MEYFLPLRQSELIIEFSKMNAQIKSKNFVGKLQYLLQEPSYQRILTWSDKNTVIEVLDSAKMQKEILPFYFRHQKFESFVRQLNLYGFKKLKSPERQRFTHHLLQAGTRLSEITSCKTSKGSSASSDGKGVVLIEKTLSQTAPSPQASQQKVGGSAFTIYNPLSQNRRNIFIAQNNSVKPQPSIWSNQSADGNIMVFPGQYLVWNWMQSFNRSYVGNILLSQRGQQQQQHIAQQ